MKVKRVLGFIKIKLRFSNKFCSKDIQKITDIEAVKRSVRNLINLNHYEKPFHRDRF